MKKKIKPAEQILAKDDKRCEAAFIRSGRDPGHLARFLKKYPAAYYLSWVKSAIAEWYAMKKNENLELLQRSRGEREFESGLTAVFTDFLIYQAITEMVEQGYQLMPNKKADGIFHKLQSTNFNGTYYSASHISRRYYRFRNYKPATFIDNDETIISGPARVQISGVDCVGFFRYTPESGSKTLEK